MIRSPITTPGPLNVSATVTAGAVYPAVTIKAPHGPEFQAITEWTGDAGVNLTSWTGSEQTRTGPRGLMIYAHPLTYADAVKVDSYLGYSIPAEVVHLWNAKEPTTAGIGPQPVYSAASTQPDANGNLVTWPNYVLGRGVEVHPAYTQMIQNPKCIGAGAGVMPTGWTIPSSGNGIAVSVVGGGLGYVDIRYRGTASAALTTDMLLTAPVAALTAQAWTFSFGISVVNGSLPAVERFAATLRERTSADANVKTNAQSIATYPADVSYTVTLSGGATTALLRAVISITIQIGTAIDCTIRVSNPQLTQTAYKMPFVVPNGAAIETVSVASTAATSAGNGLAIPLDARMIAALGGIFTAAALVCMGASSAEITADTNILAFSNVVTGGIYAASGGIFKATDGTNTATVTVAGGWAKGETPLICLWINGAGTQMQVGYKKAAESTITWGAAANYDGSFGPGTHMRWGYTSGVPFGAIQSQLWAESVGTDAEILSLMRYAA